MAGPSDDVWRRYPSVSLPFPSFQNIALKPLLARHIYSVGFFWALSAISTVGYEGRANCALTLRRDILNCIELWATKLWGSPWNQSYKYQYIEMCSSKVPLVLTMWLCLERKTTPQQAGQCTLYCWWEFHKGEILPCFGNLESILFALQSPCN